MARALVLGGSGFVGSALVRELVKRGHDVDFTFHSQRARAEQLATASGAHAHALDARNPAEITALFDHLAPTLLAHTIGLSEPGGLADLDATAWDRMQETVARSAFVALREFSRRCTGPGSVVLACGLDASRPTPTPPHFAAAQAALVGLVRSCSKELGVRGIRVNGVAFGTLDGGISGTLDPALRDAYRKFSALQRLGTAEEAARTLASVLCAPGFMTGAIVNANGGL